MTFESKALFGDANRDDLYGQLPNNNLYLYQTAHVIKI